MRTKHAFSCYFLFTVFSIPNLFVRNAAKASLNENTYNNKILIILMLPESILI